MNKSEITFMKSLKEYGLTRFVKSPGLYIALIASYGYWYYKVYCEVYGAAQTNFANILLSTAAGLFSILFAAFAIIIALSDKEFVMLLKKTGKLNNILFPFWLVSFIYILSIAVNLVAVLDVGSVSIIAAVGGVFLFSIAMVETFYLVSTTVKFGLYRAEIVGTLPELEEARRRKSPEPKDV